MVHEPYRREAGPSLRITSIILRRSATNGRRSSTQSSAVASNGTPRATTVTIRRFPLDPGSGTSSSVRAAHSSPERHTPAGTTAPPTRSDSADGDGEAAGAALGDPASRWRSLASSDSRVFSWWLSSSMIVVATVTAGPEGASIRPKKREISWMPSVYAHASSKPTPVVIEPHEYRASQAGVRAGDTRAATENGGWTFPASPGRGEAAGSAASLPVLRGAPAAISTLSLHRAHLSYSHIWNVLGDYLASRIFTGAISPSSPIGRASAPGAPEFAGLAGEGLRRPGLAASPVRDFLPSLGLWATCRILFVRISAEVR